MKVIDRPSLTLRMHTYKLWVPSKGREREESREASPGLGGN